jgi:hypothetical protein
MLIPSSDFFAKCFENHSLLWNSAPRDELEQTLLEYENKIALRFYDLFRLRAGEKIQLSELNDRGISTDEAYSLYLVLLLKIQYSMTLFADSDNVYFVFNLQVSA